jgi:hypothetical protein
MPRVGFEPTPLDRAATVIGIGSLRDKIILNIRSAPRNSVSVMNLRHKNDELYNLHFFYLELEIEEET